LRDVLDVDVLVAFSGGVDSCLTALLLRREGYRVAGIIMSVRDPLHPTGQGCGMKEDIAAAQALANHIEMPLIVADCADAYRSAVIDYFRAEYLAGRTPNPCVQCNPLIKFGLLPKIARTRGARFHHFATGHYANIEYSEADNAWLLKRGVDTAKDQSYFLYRLSQEQLASTWFPLGRYRKTEVRRLAAELNVPVHDKPDSQDFSIGDYAELIGKPPMEGDIVMSDGTVMGKHQGYWNFTPGQRKGLGIAYTEPLFVIRVVPECNRVVVGTRHEHMRSECVIDNPVFHLPQPDPGTVLLGRMRSSQSPHEMSIGNAPRDGALAVHFAKPQHGVAAGQSIVFYRDDFVVGGGVITEK
jgi:tRNA (5-methylaminomethyl-2-thiouridylate)-methyltransferase